MGAGGRRGLLAAGGALAAAAAIGPARIGRAAAAEPAHLLVAGSRGGALDRWAGLLAAALRGGWPSDAGMDARAVGGDDGVTGANQFEARDPGDGTALLLPGAAAAAWLAGDPRVHFDAARWLPVMCGVSGGVLAGRRPLFAASRSAPMRLALTDRLGPAAACLLGLDLLGVAVLPVAEADGAAALRAGRVDAAFVPDAQGDIGIMAHAAALFTLGPPERAGADARDPAMMEVPALPELLARVGPSDPELLAGWYAAAAAAQLDYALVLPSLSAAPSVALWREAASRAVDDPALRAAAPADTRALAAPGCGVVLGAIAARSAALLAYRRWLALRLGYLPG